MSWVGLGWGGLGWVGLGWVGLKWAEVNWFLSWLRAGVDIPAILQELPSFVSSFDYSLAGQVFLQQAAATGSTAHLDTLSVQHAAEAVQVHGLHLLERAQQAVVDLVTGHMQDLCQVLSQQEVVTVLEAARTAVRASADAEGEGLAALHVEGDSRPSAGPSGLRRDTNADLQHASQNQASSSCDSGDLERCWLGDLSAAQLVEHAEMVQAGLQQQQLASTHQSCLGHISDIVTGATLLCCDVPCHVVPCHAMLCCAGLGWAVLCRAVLGRAVPGRAVLCCAVLCIWCCPSWHQGQLA